MEATETLEKPKPGRKQGRWRKLGNIAEVKMALAHIIKRVYDNELPTERGAVCISGLRTLAQVMHESDLEERMAAIEERLRASAS